MARHFFERIVNLWGLWLVLFLLATFAVWEGMLLNLSAVETVAACVGVLTLLLLTITLVAALLLGRKRVALWSALSIVPCLIVGIITMTVCILADPDSKPTAPPLEADYDWYELMSNDTVRVSTLSAEIEKNSWWTDGDVFYQVVSTRETIRMEGYGLHEGGAVCAFEVKDGQLLTAMPSEGYTSFGEPGCEVSHHLIKSADDDREYEILVVYEDGKARLVLQRFEGEGKELAFVEQCIHEMLADTYSEYPDTDNRWIFNEDGTVQMPGMETAKPYTIELGYHMPTGVVRLPDGSRVGLLLGYYTLQVCKAVYDEDEEYWRDTDQLLKTLYVCDRNVAIAWACRRPALQGMFGRFTSEAYPWALHAQLEGIDEPMAILNYTLTPEKPAKLEVESEKD